MQVNDFLEIFGNSIEAFFQNKFTQLRLNMQSIWNCCWVNIQNESAESILKKSYSLKICNISWKTVIFSRFEFVNLLE